ncbi:MAG: hypothetical protein ACE5FO_09000, partial [Parvularculaceae bacterium]
INRAFDFWTGDWEVYNLKGEKAGENSITIEENGCLLVERWKGSGGGTGQSYNFVDLATGEWRQVWVSAGATIDYSGGLNEEGAMVLEGEISYRNGKKRRFAEPGRCRMTALCASIFRNITPKKMRGRTGLRAFTGGKKSPAIDLERIYNRSAIGARITSV